MKVLNFKIDDAIAALNSYPRRFDDDYSNYPQELGHEYENPCDDSGSEKYTYYYWNWFSSATLKHYPINKIIEAYNSISSTSISRSVIDGQIITELSEKDMIALLIGGATACINLSNLIPLELRKLGSFTNADSHSWRWNRKVLDNEIPYTLDELKELREPGVPETIGEDLVNLYNRLTGAKLEVVNE